jgi:hypothetical protein
MKAKNQQDLPIRSLAEFRAKYLPASNRRRSSPKGIKEQAEMFVDRSFEKLRPILNGIK